MCHMNCWDLDFSCPRVINCPLWKQNALVIQYTHLCLYILDFYLTAILLIGFFFFFKITDLALVQYKRTDLFVVTFVWVVFLFVCLLFPTRGMLKVVKLLFWSVDKTDKFLLWPYSYTTNTLSFITYCNTLCEKGIYLHVLSKLSLLILNEDGTV